MNGVYAPDNWTNSSIGRRFLDTAQQHRLRRAVTTTAGSLTYHDIADRALRVAAGILEACGPGSRPIGVWAADTQQAVPAILGILLAGKIYVPLDPSYPADRLRHMLEHAELELMLADPAAEPPLPSTVPVIALDTLTATDPLDPQQAATDPEAIASILYTSGSTGAPKGVIQTHRNILFHIGNLTRRFAITTQDRHSLIASLSFDASTTDLYSALLNGAELVSVDARREGLSRLWPQLREHRVSMLHSTPTVFRHLLHYAEPGEVLDSTRVVILGGEPLARRDIRAFTEHFGPDCLLVNGYGATETGGFTAIHVVETDKALDTATIPIGEPMPGVRLLLRPLQDQPGTDDQGELIVASEHLGVGYWRDTAATAAVFTQENLPEGPANLYRTGDLARRDSEGSHYLIGRRDRQVKVRGQRIDLTEIEDAIAAIPGVGQVAVALANNDRADDAELIAWLTPAANCQAPDSETVRRTLAGTLLPAAIPGRVIVVGALPLTPTGKIDPTALIRTADIAITTHARPGIEADLTRMWQAVLGHPVSRDQNFFDAGGNSLLTSRVHALLEQQVRHTVPIAWLYEHPTIATLAAALAAGMSTGNAPLPAGGRWGSAGTSLASQGKE